MKKRTINHWLVRASCYVVAVLIVFSLIPSVPLFAVSPGDAQILYGAGTSQTPVNRTLGGSGWNAGTNLPTVNGGVRHIVTKAAPNRTELLAGVFTNNGVLVVFLFNGSTWSEQWRVSLGSSDPNYDYVPRYDIAYEQISGRAMVAYSNNQGTTNQIAYRQWNGTSWSAAAYRTATHAGSIACIIRLEPRRGTNEIALAWTDLDMQLSAAYYDGATSSWKPEPSSLLDDKVAWTGTIKLGSKEFDMAFEDVSGRLMLVWGNDTTTYPYYVIRSAGANGTWGAKVAGNAGFTSQGMDMQLAAEPGTNYIAYVNVADYNSGSGDTFQRASAAVWNGSSWGYYNSFDTSVSQLQPSLVRISVKWVKSGGQSRALVVYDDDNAAGVDWLYFNKNTLSWASVQPDFTGSPSPPSGDNMRAAAASMWLYNNPFNASELLYVTVTWNMDTGVGGLYTKKLTFNGTAFSWTNIETTALATNVSYRGGWSVGFAYFQYVPPVGSLSIDFVNGANASIASPVVAFPAAASGSSCQTVVASLGDASQKIRIANTTANGSWSVSLAPSGGSGARWNAAAAGYDMNDPGGAGCTDGSDTDSVAGRLSVNPSAAIITPQSGCSTTGISKGSTTAFSEGSVDSVTLFTASSSVTSSCSWDITGIAMGQTLPAFQTPGTYSLPMTVTITSL